MAVNLPITDRRVIPNWRDFKRTLHLRELQVNYCQKKKFLTDINRPLKDWQQSKNIGTAADLINSVYISGKEDIDDEINSAIDFVLQNSDQAFQSLIDISLSIRAKGEDRNTSGTKDILEKRIDSLEEFQSISDSRLLDTILKKTKSLTRQYPLNAIYWVDIARLYTIKAQYEKAEKAILIALSLAPDNRFVLRSATRFLIHVKEFEKAIYFLRKSQAIVSDPWLISAHIATSTIIGRFSPFIKNGKALIESKNIPNFDLTELAASIGTLEFKDGTYKKAKQLFNKSLESPNDNSLAQLEWVSSHDSRFEVDPLTFKGVANPFEAYSIDFFERGNWKESFYNSVKWLMDMPFSKRPAILGSYVSGELLKDYKSAISMCELGLKANPNETTLLNNYIYYKIKAGYEIEGLVPEINQMILSSSRSKNETSKIYVLATLGLVDIKLGNHVDGIRNYESAIEIATKTNNQFARKMAILFLTQELYLNDLSGKEKYLGEIYKMKNANNPLTLTQKIEEVLKLTQSQHF